MDRKAKLATAIVPLALFVSQSARAQLPAERDWSATLQEDAQALHDDIAANHPGPVNRDDSGFAGRNDAQLRIALERAQKARSFSDYYFALRMYVASFDDGHLSFGAFHATPSENSAWPGFLTAYDSRGVQRVVVRTDASPVPIGARLLSCDGRSAKQVAAETLGAQWGRWKLESQRQRWGFLLFSSEGNPYVRRPIQCTFRADHRRQTITLAWRHLSPVEMDVYEKAARRPASYSFAALTLSDMTRWYAIPSFDANPQSTAGKSLPPMIAQMRGERATLAEAPAIVLDLRGNGGGSSDWSRQIAKILWGADAVRKLPADKTYVDWRVSPANLQSIEDSYARQKGKGTSADDQRWFEQVITGLRGALTRHAPLWRQEDDEDPAFDSDVAAEAKPLRAPVYLLTDANCASACLDAVDLWRDLGAIHIGRTTSADTLYMDIRYYKLPSGITGGGMPMKIYRNRPRGSNVPVKPVHSFDGDITDTVALEKWVVSLRSRRSDRRPPN